MISNSDSKLFSDKIYESISHFLLPTTHQKEDGKYVKLSKDDVTSYIESVLSEEEVVEEDASEESEDE